MGSVIAEKHLVKFDAWFSLFVVRNRIPEVTLMDDQDWISRLPGVDSLLHFASVTGECPAWVSTGTHDQIMSL